MSYDMCWIQIIIDNKKKNFPNTYPYVSHMHTHMYKYSPTTYILSKQHKIKLLQNSSEYLSNREACVTYMRGKGTGFEWEICPPED